jgi:predicted Zn-dependent protease
VILNETDARALTDKILALSKADSCCVTVSGFENRHLRYAQNMATTSGAPTGFEIDVESHFGKRSGSASGTDFTDAALADLVSASETTARRAPENPEFMPPLGPQTFTPGSAFFDSTQNASAAALAAAVAPVLQKAARAGPRSRRARAFSLTTATPTCSTPSPRARPTAQVPAGPARR